MEITIGAKETLTLTNPVMPAAGTFGFGGEYARLLDLSLLGAVVTNPITWKPRKPAGGQRVVPMVGGVLVHTGLPNPGLLKIVACYKDRWGSIPAPVIVHVTATSPDDVLKCAETLDGLESVTAVELGMHDAATPRDVEEAIGAALTGTEKPIIVRLPLCNAVTNAQVAQEAGAHAVTMSAPPRGTVRDPVTGRLVGGRLYGPWVKAVALRAVGRATRTVRIPIFGCGGIHSPQDARDFIEAGASAVQVDAAIWVRPEILISIARDLGGLEKTRVAGSWPDEV